MRLEAIALPMVRLALTEDVGGGDATTDAVVDASARARAHIEARHEGILAGSGVAALAFRELDPEMQIAWSCPDGGTIPKGTPLATLEGSARAILTAERVALNFLQHLSGIATLAGAFVKAVEGTGVHILDTRKTTPGLRILEKYAVLAGGAMNHRFGLFDGVLVKENHIKAAGGVAAAVTRAKESAQPKGLPVVVEVRSVEDAIDVAGMGVDRLLLDNFTPPKIAEVVKRLGLGKKTVRTKGKSGAPEAGGAAGGPPEIEVSGGVRLANVREYAIPGVSYISIGALTHSAPALDLSLILDENL
ncbi:MAG TPA: carboxylating nicotinate-nucleotide diphosphorylase [Candidatus Omnitrophota bacterium]|nr:carboxylating nicotinate-nucleotide diphosphorylase [Candidatus Omnitrophota bacterium]